MTVDLLNPSDLPTPSTYSHIAIATGTKLVFIAGQEPEDLQGELVGPGDLAVQARLTFENLGRALAAAGARPDQVTRLGIYLVGYRRDYQPVIQEARYAVFGDHKPADVMIGVAALARPEQLIEVEATAVI
ncbi:RidA family protein [Kribbella albertanoniae]|uniref:RidA family protein n=1 Tax=Kribbella albertanoniae TaxID=1266829 RepID=A0A4R4PIM2_9ACTN|nr:RidA family protein [Kribbella albertanoniae]TDC21748.1 RidA family protein [Kribbella albertanoniae]